MDYGDVAQHSEWEWDTVEEAGGKERICIWKCEYHISNIRMRHDVGVFSHCLVKGWRDSHVDSCIQVIRFPEDTQKISQSDSLHLFRHSIGWNG